MYMGSSGEFIMIKEVKPVSEVIARPDCEAPKCSNPKEAALILVAGKWVCGDCAMKKQEEINAGVWG